MIFKFVLTYFCPPSLFVLSPRGRHLGDAVSENTGLRSLSLAWNAIRGAGAVMLANGLGVRPGNQDRKTILYFFYYGQNIYKSTER